MKVAYNKIIIIHAIGPFHYITFMLFNQGRPIFLSKANLLINEWMEKWMEGWMDEKEGIKEWMNDRISQWMDQEMKV